MENYIQSFDETFDETFDTNRDTKEKRHTTYSECCMPNHYWWLAGGSNSGPQD